jgi:hypothetical protein
MSQSCKTGAYQRGSLSESWSSEGRGHPLEGQGEKSLASREFISNGARGAQGHKSQEHKSDWGYFLFECGQDVAVIVILSGF